MAEHTTNAALLSALKALVAEIEGNGWFYGFRVALDDARDAILAAEYPKPSRPGPAAQDAADMAAVARHFEPEGDS